MSVSAYVYAALILAMAAKTQLSRQVRLKEVDSRLLTTYRNRGDKASRIATSTGCARVTTNENLSNFSCDDRHLL